MSKFSCIVPFYNEGENVVSVLTTLTGIKEISEIIAVDDGSTDNISSEIKAELPNIKLIILHKNIGKANAIKVGLDSATSVNIMLIDADYRDLVAQEITHALQTYLDRHLDMLVLKVHGGNNVIDRMLQKEILLSGFRVLKTIDLKQVVESEIRGYQLETSINRYMLLNHKQIRWMNCSAKNIHKAIKWGLVEGYLKSIKMESLIYSSIGIVGWMKQIFQIANHRNQVVT